ncbi:hypothetical protein ACI78T_03115 [Blastococcus sp. SYSU D00922]
MSDRSVHRVPLPAVVALVVTLLALLLTAFAWPAVRSAPRDVPVAVAAPPPVAAQVTEALEQARPGAFEPATLPDEAAARRAIAERDVYGAVVVGPRGAEVLTASAGGPVVAQTLQQVAVGLSERLGTPVPVEDLVPAPADDPRGAALATGALPLALGGIVATVLLIRTTPGLGRRFAGASAIALGGGLALAALLQAWLGALDGNYWATSGVLALGLGATAFALLGLHAVAGTPGLGVGAAVVVLLGNPLSGAASAPEFLPTGWGELGQVLPPGATVSALRSVAFFDGAAAAGPLWILAAWASGGLVLAALSALNSRRPVPAGAPPTPAERPAAVRV